MSTNEFQSKTDQAVEEFSIKLFNYCDGHMGFDTPGKAADPSLAQRNELQLGNLTDQELAHEINILNGFLREERELYQRGTYFYRLLDAAEQRIKHLSGRLARMGKDVVGNTDEALLIGSLPEKRDWIAQISDDGTVITSDPKVKELMQEEDTLNHTYQNAEIELADIGPVPDHIQDKLDRGREEYLATGGLGEILQDSNLNPTINEFDIDGLANVVRDRLVDDLHEHTRNGVFGGVIQGGDPSKHSLAHHKRVFEFLPTDGTSNELTSVYGLPAMVLPNSGSVMICNNFPRTLKEINDTLTKQANTFVKLQYLVDCVGRHMDLPESCTLRELADGVLKAYPSIPDRLVLDCYMVGNPGAVYLSSENLEKLVQKWTELHEVIYEARRG